VHFVESVRCLCASFQRMRTPYRPGVDRVKCKVGSPKVFSLSVSTPPLFASSNQIIRAHYHLIQAERSSHYHLLSAENDDVIKHGCGCNQFATHSDSLFRVTQWCFYNPHNGDVICLRRCAVNNPHPIIKSKRIVRAGPCLKKRSDTVGQPP
jgi:hypothetical protein